MVQQSKTLPWGTGLLVLGVTLGTVLVGDLLSRTPLLVWSASAETLTVFWAIAFILLAAGGMMVVYEAGTFIASLSPLGLYFTMLASAAAWNLAMYGFEDPAIALGILAALWLLIVALFQEYLRYSRLAAWLQLPPLAWVSALICLSAYSAFPTLS